MRTDTVATRRRIAQLETETQTLNYKVEELQEFQKLVETETQTLNHKVEELQKIVFPWYRRNIDRE
jgi:outer membrane murein-binding lipoprotein Lpp